MTTHHIYAPGVDYVGEHGQGPIPNGGAYDPARGPGGVFARTLQGMTPKYARNMGPREDMYKDTLARMYMYVPGDERAHFYSSITDPTLRQAILPQLVGPSGTEVSDTGYVDFILQRVSASFSEKMHVPETLADNYVAYFFGQNAPQWQYQGTLINTVQDDQLSAWVRLYIAVLRGTQEARRGKTVMLRYDNFLVEGTIFNTQWQHDASNEIAVPFSFSLLVKRLRIVNSTLGWRPTQPNSPWSTDPLLNTNATSNSPSRAGATTPTTVAQGAGLPAPPESSAAANVRTATTSSESHLRSSDVQQSVGATIPAGTRVTVLEPGTQTRTINGQTSRSYLVDVGGQRGYMFFRDNQLSAVDPPTAPSTPSPADTAAASASGGTATSSDLVPEIPGVRPQDQAIVNGANDGGTMTFTEEEAGANASYPVTPRAPTPRMGNGAPAPSSLSRVCR